MWSEALSYDYCLLVFCSQRFESFRLPQAVSVSVEVVLYKFGIAITLRWFIRIMFSL